MIIRKIICDHCEREIPECEPKLMVHGGITFDKGNRSSTMREREFDCHYCKQCGYELFGALFRKDTAKMAILDWTGEVDDGGTW